LKVAIKIDQSEWRNIVNHLYQNGWKVKEKYIGNDASIDYDYIILTKNWKSIEMGWEILDGGEIKCDKDTFEYLESLVNHKFEYGNPIILKVSKLKFISRILSFPTRLFWNKKFLMDNFFYFKSTDE